MLGVVLVLLVGFVSVLVIASLVPEDPGDGTDDSGTPAVASTDAVPATEVTVPATTTSPTTTEPAVSAGLTDTPPSTIQSRPDFGGLTPADGRLAVGQDIQPGRYLAESPVLLCYWERLSGLGGTDDEIVVNGLVPGEHVIVDVLASDAALDSQGCGEWRPYAPPAEPKTTLTDGDWLVGSDVPPGVYRARNGIHGPVPCSWERASAFTHAPDEILAHDKPGTDPVRVELHDGERFSTNSCGYWALVD